MKVQNKINNKNFLKKLFVKICRIFGYEIIDQGNFFIPTQKKSLNENLSIPGKNQLIYRWEKLKFQEKLML